MKTPAGSFGYDLAIDVAAPVETVWAAVADYDRDATWREGVTMRCEPPGLVRDGTRTFEVLRAFGGEHRKVARIEDVVPGRSFRFRGEDGTFEGSRAVSPVAGGARLRVTLRAEVSGLLAVFAPLLGWLFRRRVRRDLERLRTRLTEEHATANHAAAWVPAPTPID